MSFHIHFDGHVSPEDPKKDEIIRRAAHAFSSILNACGIEHSGRVGTPTGGGTIDASAPLRVSGETLHTNTADPASTPTNNKPK